MRTCRWIWGMVWNRPLVWENPDGSFSHTEKVNRFRGPLTRWDLRPMWFHTALTHRRECGCRKRLGIWPTMWCSNHSSIDLDADL